MVGLITISRPELLCREYPPTAGQFISAILGWAQRSTRIFKTKQLRERLRDPSTTGPLVENSALGDHDARELPATRLGTVLVIRGRVAQAAILNPGRLPIAPSGSRSGRSLQAVGTAVGAFVPTEDRIRHAEKCGFPLYEAQVAPLFISSDSILSSSAKGRRGRSA